MTDQELSTFSEYFATLCDLDVDGRQKLVAIFPEHVNDLRRESLENAKEALRLLLKGRPPFGVGPKLSRVIGLLEERRKEENAGKAKVGEYLYSPGEVYLQERAMKRELQPHWDALTPDQRQARLAKSAGELGYTWHPAKRRWVDGQGMALPDSWVLQRALRTFGEELELEVRQ